MRSTRSFLLGLGALAVAICFLAIDHSSYARGAPEVAAFDLSKIVLKLDLADLYALPAPAALPAKALRPIDRDHFAIVGSIASPRVLFANCMIQRSRNAGEVRRHGAWLV